MRKNTKECIKKLEKSNLTKHVLALRTRSSKGITLVTLVVTIIVLLILAGVSINNVIGEEGMVRRSQETANKIKDQSKRDEQEMNDLINDIDESLEK